MSTSNTSEDNKDGNEEENKEENEEVNEKVNKEVNKEVDKDVNKGVKKEIHDHDMEKQAKCIVARNISLREDIPVESYNAIERFLVGFSYVLVILFFPISLFLVFVVVRQFERVIILRNGKLRRIKTYGPGLIFYLPCIDSLKYVDLRIVSYAVKPQETLTKDSLNISVDAVVHYRINDAVDAILRVKDYKNATQYLAKIALRNAIASRLLAEVLTNRRAVSRQVFETMQKATADWGVLILRVEIKHIRLPIKLQKSMAAEAQSSRLTNANITVTQAEIECAKSLKKAAEVLASQPYGMQIRFLEAMQQIAGDQTHTIVVPMSILAFGQKIVNQKLETSI